MGLFVDLGRLTGAAALTLGRAGPAHRLVFQLVVALALASMVPGWVVAFGLDRSVPPNGQIAVLLLLVLLSEALVAPAYFRQQMAVFRRPSAAIEKWPSTVRRTWWAAVIVVALRLIVTAAAALPGLFLLVIGRVLDAPQLRSIAPGVGVAGMATAYVVAWAATSFVTRIAVDGGSLWRSIVESATIARRVWPALLGMHLVVWLGLLALVGGGRLVPLLVLAAVLRWLRDLALSGLCAMGGAPRRPCRMPVRRRGRASAGLAATVAVVLTLGPSGIAGAGEGLVQAVAPAPAASGRLVVHSTELAAGEAKAELVTRETALADFQRANLRLTDAEERLTDIDAQLRVARRGVRLGSPDAKLAEIRRLVEERTAGRKLVGEREAELAAASTRILSSAYGAPFGSYERNLIDIKHTGSFLLGMGEGTWEGMKSMAFGAKELVEKGYGKLTGAPTPVVAAGPVDPDAERNARLLAREEVLATDLQRITDPAGANRRLGNVAGAEIIAPALAIETGLSAARLTYGMRTAQLAKREAALTAEATARTQLAVRQAALAEEAIAGLPRVSGRLVGDTLGQGGQYLPFRLANGTEALVYRGQYGAELASARKALDLMEKAQPGLMPKVHGSVRLADGQPALVLERFEQGQVAMHSDRTLFVEPFRGVFTSEGHQTWRTFGGFGRALDNDYLFLVNGRPRLSLPRRAGQFLELIEGGRVFRNTGPLVTP